MAIETRVVRTLNTDACPLPEPDVFEYSFYTRRADFPSACADGEGSPEIILYSSSATLEIGITLFEDEALTTVPTGGFYRAISSVVGGDEIVSISLGELDVTYTCP